MTTQPSQKANRLLARLSEDIYERIGRDLEPVSLEFKQVLYEPHAEVDYVYFPTSGSMSALTIMSDGAAIEVASVGREGALGVFAAFGPMTSPHKVIAQIAGDGLRMKAKTLRSAAAKHGELQSVLLKYYQVFHGQVSQSVACNGLHTLAKRCCRWLLLTHDRARSVTFELTHEFLAMMLGVRRSGVTEALQQLRDRGLIDYTHGSITILERKGLEAACCECYQLQQDEYKRVLG